MVFKIITSSLSETIPKLAMTSGVTSELEDVILPSWRFGVSLMTCDNGRLQNQRSVFFSLFEEQAAYCKTRLNHKININ